MNNIVPCTCLGMSSVLCPGCVDKLNTVPRVILKNSSSKNDIVSKFVFLKLEMFTIKQDFLFTYLRTYIFDSVDGCLIVLLPDEDNDKLDVP